MAMNLIKPKRRSWDTSVKHLIRLGCVDAVPAELLQTIPRSCISRWKYESNEKYLGNELNGIAKEKLELIQEFAKNKNAKRAFVAYGRLVNTLITIVSDAKEYQKRLRHAKEKIVEVIDQCSQTLSVSKALKVFRISRSTYQHWLVQVKAKCDPSALLLCKRKYPFQLLGEEVKVMKQLLTDPEYYHWPVNSVAYYAIRNGLVSASVGSWYKYRNLLGIRRPRSKHRRSKWKTGIRAKAPNQVWHADITIFKTLDGIKHCIYLVVDNYSRKILSWAISSKVSGSIRMQTLRKAWERAIEQRPTIAVDLIVDGGPENINRIVDRFIQSHGINIQRKIALKEISFSNSMIEATNKMIKYQYLYQQPVADGSVLSQTLKQSIHDFNHVRPHGRLNGLTPDEVYEGNLKPIVGLASQLVYARIRRKELNQKESCGNCLS